MFSARRFFKNATPAWELVQTIDPMEPAASFGATFSSVSLNHRGNLVAIGDKSFNQGAGAVKILKYVDSWVNDLTSRSDSMIVSEVGSGPVNQGRFGQQVRLSRGESEGTEIVIGEPGTGKCAASSYYRVNISGIDWAYKFSVSDTSVGGFGGSVAVSRFGNFMAVGCGGDPPGSETSGRVRMFRNPDGLGWSQVGVDIVGTQNSRLGNNIAMKSQGPADDPTANPGFMILGTDSLDPSVEGFARAFSCSGDCSSWSQVGSDMSDEGNRYFGYFVSMNDEGTRSVISGSGVSKAFDLSGGSWVQFGQTLTGNNSKMCYIGNRIATRSSDGLRIYQRGSTEWNLISFIPSQPVGQFYDIDISGNGRVLAAANKSGVLIFKQNGYTIANFF